MASNSYPMLSASNWWNLRQKFIQSIPNAISPTLLASLLNMEERSATNNIMPYLKQVGIIDQDGKPTSRATLWRDDQDYPKVCKEIIEEVYPPELRDIAVIEDKDKESVKRWFSKATGAGSSSIAKMVSFYLLLVEADPFKNSITVKKVSAVKNGTKTATTNSKKVNEKKEQKKTSSNKGEEKELEADAKPSSYPNQPSMNINLQIHISSEATVEQIDKIFESMAKHIYNHR